MSRRTKTNNIRLVSERAGVSVATVSRVVNNRTDVSEELRKKIQTVIDELNFSPNKGAKRVFNIGVIISQEKPLMDEYLSELITGRRKMTISSIRRYRDSPRSSSAPLSS